MALPCKAAIKTVTDTLAKYVLSPGDAHGFREAVWGAKQQISHLSLHLSGEGQEEVTFFFFFLNFIATLFIYFFIFGCVGSSVRARAFSSCGKRGPLFIAVRGPLHYRGLSCCGAQAPDAQAQ